MNANDDELGDVVICRACTCECTEYKSLHIPGVLMGETTTMASLLGLCTKLEFSADEDFLPSHICTVCVQQLAKWYAFKKMVHENNEKLRLQATQEEYLYIDEIDAEQLQDQDHYKNHIKHPELPKDDLLEELLEVERLEENTEQPEESEQLVEVQRLEEFHHLNVSESRLEEYEDEAAIYKLEKEELESAVKDFEEFELTIKQEGAETENEDESNEQDFDDTDFVPAPSIEHLGFTEFVSATTSIEIVDEIEFLDKSKSKKILGIDSIDEKSNTNNPKTMCQICSKQLSSSFSLRLHMQTHAKDTPYKCNVCGERFKTSHVYKNHLLLHDPNNPHICTQCERVYRTAAMLRLHMMKHTGEKPFECYVCGARMTQKSVLKKHMLLHTGEMPHMCDICGKKFRNISNLRSHKVFHSEKKLFTCPTCEKSFHTERQFKRHVATHDVEYYRPHVCEKCHKSFKHPNSLKIHRRKEHNLYVREFRSKGQEHICDVCNKKFKNAFNLKEHKILHLAEKPFECPTCEKRFHTDRQLSRHVENHKVEYNRPYACDKCKRSYKSQKSLALHRRKEHNLYVRVLKNKDEKNKSKEVGVKKTEELKPNKNPTESPKVIVEIL